MERPYKTGNFSQYAEFHREATLYSLAMIPDTPPLQNDSLVGCACSPIHLLFDEWRTQVVAESGHFVEDGIVCDKGWQRASRKILFLLKEPNGYKGEHGALNDLLRKAAMPNSTSAMWDRPTFHNIGRWAHGLLQYSGQIPSYDDAHLARKSAVLGCAYINIKKSTGGARATKKVEVHAAKYADFLRQQVAIIKPDIVVCGGTYVMVKEHVYPSMLKISNRIHQLETTIFINAFHPGCRTDRKLVYEQVLVSFHDYMLSKS